MANPAILQKRTGTGIRSRYLSGSRTEPPGHVDQNQHATQRGSQTDQLPSDSTDVHLPSGGTDI